MAKIKAYYYIGTMSGVYAKVYDGKKLQADVLTYDGYLNTDSFQPQITNGNICHVNQYGTMAYDDTLGKNVGTLDLVYDEGYPKVFRNGVDVTDQYDQTQVMDYSFTDLTPGKMTFTIISRDITLQSTNLTKEYDGTALTGSGSTVTDLTAGVTDKGYVSGEEFTYTFTGSQLFVGSSDNTYNVSDSDTALTTDYNVTKQYGTLTVTGRTVPLTITVTDQTKTYDGTASIDTTAYSVDGELAYNDTITVTLSNSNINAGTYTNGITATYKIMHDNGDGTYTDVTDMYLNVTVDNGDLTVNKRDVTITSASDTKSYDGTKLTNDGTSVTSGSFVAGEGYVADVTGSQTEVGDSPNYFTVDAAVGTDMNNYNVTKVEGTLTVTGWDQAVVITADSESKMYDGNALTDSGYTVTGLAAGHTATATTAGSITHFGTTDNTVTSYTILDAGGNDVTSAYSNISTVDGTLSITKRDATLTSGSATKKYDGIPLTEETVTVTGSGFVAGEGANYYNFASQPAVGSTANTFRYVLSNGTFADDYAITTANGTLTVTQNDTLITITADSDSKMYDGSSLTDSGYTVTGALATGDYFASVTVSGTIIDAGTAANKVTGYTILNQAGDDVTSFYSNIQTVDGTLEVTKRSVTLTSATATKPYDGTALTNSNVAVTGDGWANGEGASYNVTGSQTDVGTSKNTFSYTLNDNTKAGNYDIATVEGDLTVTPAELVITVGLSLTTGLTYLYDNTATKVLDSDEYIVSGLAEGDQVVNVTITTDSANAGIYDEDAYTLTYDIVNAAGVSTKGSYIITENKNDVEITKRTITIASDSASKVYDGTALTCHTYTVEEGATEEYQLFAGESVSGVGITPDSTITHAGSTANKIDASDVTITKADGSDSSMNYNILTEDGTLTVIQRGVLLQSTSAEKYYDGTALQNRQVIVTGFSYDENGNVIVDEEGGFLAGDGCTYDFRNDNVVIDKDGNIIAWTVSEQSDTAYGQTQVGTSKNEFDYNNFTSVYAGSFESDYIIIYGDNQESLGLSKDTWDLYGDLTVWGGPVEINMTDYSWTYDYQAKTNGYFDDGYTVAVTTALPGSQAVWGGPIETSSAVVVTTDDAEAEKEITTIAHNSEGRAIALLGNDTIVVTVSGDGGSVETGKVQHVGDDKQNTATYAIYRDGVDVTAEVAEYYKISIDGGLLQITPRTVEVYSASDSKEYDGTALANNTVSDGSASRDKGFIFGEGAAYEVTGSQTEVGTSENTFAISKLLTDTRADDYNFVFNYGTLTVTDTTGSDLTINGSDVTPSAGTYAYDNLTFLGTGSLTLVEDAAFTAEYVTIGEGATATIAGDEVVSAKGEDSAGKSTKSKTSLTIEEGATLVTTAEQLKAFEAYKKFDVDGSTIDVTGSGTANDISWAVECGVTELSFSGSVKAKAVAFDSTEAQTFKATAWKGYTGYANTIETGSDADVRLGMDVKFYSKADKIAVGTGSKLSVLGTVDFAGGRNELSVGAGAAFSAEALNFGTGGNKVSVGAGADVKADALDGKLSQLTLKSGVISDRTAFEASSGSVVGTASADTFSFGHYSDVTLGSVNLGKGDDLVKISNYDMVAIDSLDFGTGSSDTLKIGKNSTVTVNELDVDSIDKLTISAGSKLYLGADSFADAEQRALTDKSWKTYIDNGKIASLA